MSFCSFALLLPLVLALHNTEEYARSDEFTRVHQNRLPARFRSRHVIRNGLILLTLSCATLCVLTFAWRTPLLIKASEAAVFAMMLNGLAHGIASARQGTVTPGILSAAVVVLPYCLLAAASMRLSLGESWASLLLLAAAGAALVPVAVTLSLATAYGVFQLQGRPR